MSILEEIWENKAGILIGFAIAYIAYNYAGTFGISIIAESKKMEYIFYGLGISIGMLIDNQTKRI